MVVPDAANPFGHPRRPRPRRTRPLLRKVWIPDESYFQSLVRLVSTNVESRSLTLSKFDFQGKPHIFYDDHLQLLRRSDCFVARKIWPQADRLYDTFLAPDAGSEPRAEPNPGKIDRLFAKAVERRTTGRAGLYMQSRFSQPRMGTGPHRRALFRLRRLCRAFREFRCLAVQGGGHPRARAPLCPRQGAVCRGATVYNGALSDSAALRDYNPRSFLTNLIWNTRGERQCFQFGPNDNQKIAEFIAGDPNAQISVITGAFAIPLFQSNRNFGDIRAEAARLQKIESDFLTVLRAPAVKARVRIWNLAEFVESPMEPLQTIVDEISPRSTRRLTEAPRLADLTGFGQFLQNLRNQGMQPVLMGDFPAGPDLPAPGGRRVRPYLVK